MKNKIRFIQKKMQQWFKLNKRDFPWRSKKTNKYNILVVEIMARRTTAKVVNTVYPIFIERFPNFESIHSAKINDIIEIIRPLGKYNLKSKLFKDVATFVLNSKQRSLSKVDFTQVKGIGTYTHNAFLCFAFNKKLPIVDSNVIRIYSRFFGIKVSKIDKPIKEINSIANLCLPSLDFKNYNQALIDFGGIVCVPQIPNCQKCPLTDMCNLFNR